MQAKFERLETRLVQLTSVFGSEHTPCQILLQMESNKRLPRVQQGESSDSAFSRSHLFEDLTSKDLDTPLTEPSFAQFVKSIPGYIASPSASPFRGVRFKRCMNCLHDKVYSVRNRLGQHKSDLEEFPRRLESRCPSFKLSCKDCLLSRLKFRITQEWWRNLGSDQWLNCQSVHDEPPIWIMRVGHLRGVLSDYTPKEILQVEQM